MKIPRRAPREVYRLYGEREYLAGAGAMAGTPAGDELTDLPPVSPQIGRARLPMLLGAVTALTVAIVVLHARPQRRQAARGASAPARSADQDLVAASTPHVGVRPQPQPMSPLEQTLARRRRLLPARRLIATPRAAMPVAAAEPARPIASVASQSPAPDDAPQPEFGFER